MWVLIPTCMVRFKYTVIVFLQYFITKSYKHKKVIGISQCERSYTQIDPTINILLYLLYHMPNYPYIYPSIQPSILFFYAFQRMLQTSAQQRLCFVREPRSFPLFQSLCATVITSHPPVTSHLENQAPLTHISGLL